MLLLLIKIYVDLFRVDLHIFKKVSGSQQKNK